MQSFCFFNLSESSTYCAYSDVCLYFDSVAISYRLGQIYSDPSFSLTFRDKLIYLSAKGIDLVFAHGVKAEFYAVEREDTAKGCLGAVSVLGSFYSPYKLSVAKVALFTFDILEEIDADILEHR